MTHQTRVIIAGYGQMGHALESLLHGRAGLHHWDIAPDRLGLPPDGRAAAATADFLLICVPTVAHAAVLDGLGGLLSAGAAVLSIAKGLDEEGRTAAGILDSRFGSGRAWGVLGGPMIADEILAGRPAFAELGTAATALAESAHCLFPAAHLRLTHTPIPEAVSWCGVLKNIYAPLVGIADESGWGDNVRGHLIMAALAEMQCLLATFAGPASRAYGDAGLADFVTTVTSASSHHYALGRRVARGEFGAMECEGVHSLRVLSKHGRIDGSVYPLCGVAADLAADPARVPAALHDWLMDAG
jgi:glycerol-3-phosphate dehydrogenase (NAD(P)+)